MKYYTADTHFGDTRIIDLCNRPFKNMRQMTDAIARKWNATVDSRDDVYVLGDFAYGFRGDLSGLIDSLSGRKHLVIGNHDINWLKNEKNRRAFKTISNLNSINDGGRKVLLCHYPLCAITSNSTKFHVYGHVHNNYDEPAFGLVSKLKNSYNAGVDVNDFTPATLDELIQRNE